MSLERGGFLSSETSGEDKQYRVVTHKAIVDIPEGFLVSLGRGGFLSSETSGEDRQYRVF